MRQGKDETQAGVDGYGRIRLRFGNKNRGIGVVLHPLEIVSVPVDKLGEVVGSLSGESQLIVAALDELLARAWK
jgi:hypothetical protein